jgi:hypothetical protein
LHVTLLQAVEHVRHHKLGLRAAGDVLEVVR